MRRRETTASEETAEPAIDADAAWARFGGFGLAGDWHPALAQVQADGADPVAGAAMMRDFSRTGLDALARRTEG